MLKANNYLVKRMAGILPLIVGILGLVGMFYLGYRWFVKPLIKKQNLSHKTGHKRPGT
jgi:hypothetical protein